MKTMTEEYQEYLRERKRIRERNLGEYYTDQEARYVPPFQIYGNVYYVGDSWVCVHLIDTGDGLLLIDAGNSGATAMLVHAIWSLGFRPDDIRWIILSHGHVDHIGGARFLRNMFGCKLYMGAPDCEMFRLHPEQAHLQNGPDLDCQIFTPDEEIHDGDVLRFGHTEITCRMVPGHTAGCVALFFDAVNGQETRRVGYYGGFGFNTLTKAFLTEIGDTQLHMWDTYLHSLESVKQEKVELFLGNHANNNQTVEKRRFMLEHPEAPNPFLNAEEWAIYLSQTEENFRRFQEEERKK